MVCISLLILFSAVSIILFCFLFEGGRTHPEIVAWLNKKTGPAATPLETAEAVKTFTEKEVAVVGFFLNKESDAAKAFLAAADGIDDVEFGIVSDAAIATENKVDGDKIVLFKKVCTVI
jgi:protein disulfide-isomerase A1